PCALRATDHVLKLVGLTRISFRRNLLRGPFGEEGLKTVFVRRGGPKDSVSPATLLLTPAKLQCLAKWQRY
ncbi:hypothetical protein COCMIDRAFT_106820, partial [Bipolaris oryzae ATCC 44560]